MSSMTCCRFERLLPTHIAVHACIPAQESSPQRAGPYRHRSLSTKFGWKPAQSQRKKDQKEWQRLCRSSRASYCKDFFGHSPYQPGHAFEEISCAEQNGCLRKELQAWGATSCQFESSLPTQDAGTVHNPPHESAPRRAGRRRHQNE